MMRFLPVIAGPPFLADRGLVDGAFRRNAGFPPAIQFNEHIEGEGPTVFAHPASLASKAL
jgi:hypothetical protein